MKIMLVMTNLVPRAFPLKNFLRERLWGRGSVMTNYAKTYASPRGRLLWMKGAGMLVVSLGV